MNNGSEKRKGKTKGYQGKGRLYNLRIRKCSKEVNEWQR